MIWQPRQIETPLVPPHGSGIITPSKYGRGCRVLRREDEVGDSCPLLRSAPGFRTIPRADWRDWVDAGVNNSALVYQVMNQGSVGSCASESASQSLMLVRETMGFRRVVFNPYGIYGRVNGGSDRGSTLGANLKFVRDVGAFPEDIWPRSKGWRQRPSDEAYEAASNYRLDEFYEITNWNEFASALLQGWVVYWGYSGHAIVAVDLINDSQFIYLNSWGNWGSSTQFSSIEYGFGVANMSSIVWGYAVYAFRSAIAGKGDLKELLSPAA